jgi:uncharacterized phage protein (TIGR02218 family)
MKTLSTDMLSHLKSEVTTIRTCWRATLVNGTVYGFTDHTQDLTINGAIYLAASGHTPSSIVNNSTLAVDNLDIQGVLDSAAIDDVDVHAGLWDFASVEIFQVNVADLSMGIIRQHRGHLGEVSLNRNSFTAELRGLAQQMQQTIGDLYSPTCRANLGDAQCGINLAAITVMGTISDVTNNRSFSDSGRSENMSYFDSGKLTWLTGENTGLAMEIKTFTAGLFVLYLPMPFQVAVGDTYSASPGCKKRFAEDCITKFNNAVNFRGEPHVPGNDQMMQVGGA